MILVFDCETTGLTQSTLPADHPTQPHLVQLGVILATPEGTESSVAELIVKPDGWTIPEGAARVHGITTEIAHDLGVPLATVASVFFNLRARAHELTAFNLDFDDLVMRAVEARLGRKASHPGPERTTCCMREAAPIVGLPPTAKMIAAGFTKNKPPNLAEAYRHFFGRDFAGRAHSALADARACLEIFTEMRRRAGGDEAVRLQPTAQADAADAERQRQRSTLGTEDSQHRPPCQRLRLEQRVRSPGAGGDPRRGLRPLAACPDAEGGPVHAGRAPLRGRVEVARGDGRLRRLLTRAVRREGLALREADRPAEGDSGAMSDEDALWLVVRDELAMFGRMVRVENMLEPGTPDVSYVLRNVVTAEGWMELKHMHEWPIRPETTVCIRRLTKEQVLWQEGWARAGGRVCTLLRVGAGARAEFLRLDPPLVRRVFERTITRAELTSCCDARRHRTVGRDRGVWLRWLIG